MYRQQLDDKNLMLFMIIFLENSDKNFKKQNYLLKN